MQRHRFRWVMIVVLGAPMVPGCGGSIYDPPKPPAAGEQPFISKGKLKADMDAKAKMKSKAEGGGKKVGVP
jgi:hypothetical protein